MKARGITSIDQALRGIGGVINTMGHLKWRNSEIAYYIDGQLFDPQGTATLMFNVEGRPYRRPFASAGEARGGQILYGPTVSEVEAAVPFHTIEKISFIRPEFSLVLGPSYGGAAIAITTKSGNKVHWERQFELKDYLPLGYQNYKEYSSPMLSVDADEYDIQTQPTILWLPSVKFDESGKTIDLKFPVNTNHRVVIEGVAENGDIICDVLQY